MSAKAISGSDFCCDEMVLRRLFLFGYPLMLIVCVCDRLGTRFEVLSNVDAKCLRPCEAQICH